MITISILNFKGGTGKSSLTENLSDALRRAGKRVLVIDADRQHNSSGTLLRGQATPTLTNVLKGEIALAETIKQARENLYVVPSDDDLDTAAPYILGHRAAYYTLRKQLQELEDIFVTLIDHAGAVTPVMEACLLASNGMLIPSELGVPTFFPPKIPAKRRSLTERIQV
jgi:chromosome partitioning protein